MTKKKILILGSTGSIGTSSCNCIARFRDRFEIAGLAAGKNLNLLSSQIDQFAPDAAYIADPEKSKLLEKEYGARMSIYGGSRGIEEMVEELEYDILLNALVGAAGFCPTVIALQRGKKVALANKESLVIGGDYITSILKSTTATLLPVDSEHSAILQCLPTNHKESVESIILTASGGPFRNLPREAFSSITPEQALNHPTWSMGKKITIDSSTLMNKGFEIIEAHHLFALPYDKLRVLIHPQSIIHSLVEFYDGAVLAQLGVPDMELPIQYALSFPERLPIKGERLSLTEIGCLEFFKPDLDKFPCLRLCIEAGQMGGTAPAVVNAANEIAVELFLKGSITFSQIAEIVAYALRNHAVVPADSVETILDVDKEIRNRILTDFNQKV